MNTSVSIDTKKLERGLKLSEKKIKAIHRKAGTVTTRNIRARISKDSLGLTDLRRKKVIRARIKKAHKGVGVWVGLNDISASEFKGRKQESGGGVTFRGMFFKDAFTGRYKGDPKGVRRIFRTSTRGNLVDVLIPIGEDARKYLEQMIQPMILDLFQKNFEQAVDALPHFYAKGQAKTRKYKGR